MATGGSLSHSPPIRFGGCFPGSEARSAVTSPPETDMALLLSSSEQGECESTEAPPPVSPQYEELLEVMTRAVAKLNISWPAKEHAEPQTSKLYEHFLRAKRSLPTRSMLFFPEIHTEVSRSWASPFSVRLFIPSSDYYGNMGGLKQHGYRTTPWVEQTFSSYLSPVAASSLKDVSSLPSKPIRTTSALVGKGYVAAGQSGSCLHTKLVLQAYKADRWKRWMSTRPWRVFISWCGDGAESSQLPDWYSAGVPAGLTLHRVNPLHLEGLCGGNIGLPFCSLWTVSGQKPPAYTFPPRCAEAEASSTVPFAILGTCGGVWGSL